MNLNYNHDQPHFVPMHNEESVAQIAVHDNHPLSFEELKIRANHSNKICQIIDYEKCAQVYFNPKAEDYFGVNNHVLNELGFMYMYKYLHPENYNVINTHLTYFSDARNYNKVLSHLYYVNTKKGYRWMYNSTKVVTLSNTGMPKYVFTSGIDVADSLTGKDKHKLLEKFMPSIKHNEGNFHALSSREKEIFRLIVREKSSIEIAELLKITPATADTHRNNIIQKLNVKSSVGFVKYALMYDCY